MLQKFLFMHIYVHTHRLDTEHQDIDRNEKVDDLARGGLYMREEQVIGFPLSV